MYRIILIGISLALDSMCVTIAIGLSNQQRRNFAIIFKAAIIFALFQAIMPIIGYYPVRLATSSIDLSIMNIVGGIILAGVGAHMAIAEFRTAEIKTSERRIDFYTLPKLIALGIATSIDALAIGISFGCSGERHIWLNAIIIGIITAIICIVSGTISQKSAHPVLSNRRSGLIGGAILILLGIKMLF